MSKAEVQFYFPHDVRSRGDIKIRAIIARFGMAGYGAWWVVVEILREADGDGYTIPDSPWVREALSADLPGINVEEFFQLLIDTGLLVSEGGRVYSPSLIRRMSKLEETRTKRAEAGKASGAARRAKAPPEEQEPPEAPTQPQQPATMADELREVITAQQPAEATRFKLMVTAVCDDMVARYPIKTDNRMELENVAQAAIRRGGSPDVIRAGLDQFLKEYAPFVQMEYMMNPENWLAKSKWLENWRDLGKTQRAKLGKQGGPVQNGKSGLSEQIAGKFGG